MTAAKTHLSINVSDVERSVRFYEAFFGTAAHKRRPGYANFDLDLPPLKLALNEANVSKGGALNHLGIVVPSVDEVNAARERLIKSGLATFDENDVTCCYAKQDKVWVHDPDGNAWEVCVITDDMLSEKHEEQDACCEAGCCQ